MQGEYFFFSSGLGKKTPNNLQAKTVPLCSPQSSHLISINCSGEERNQGRKLSKNYISGSLPTGCVNFQTTENKCLRKTNCGKWDF